MKKIIFCILLVFCCTCLFSCLSILFPPIKNTDMDKYLETDGLISHFAIFPQKEDISGEIIDYHNYNYQLDDGDEIYLEVIYTQEAFETEISRLEKVKYYSNKFHYENEIKKDDCVLFNYLTYVSTYNNGNGKYEYACVIPSECRIVYITIKEMSLERISFNSKYLPKTYYIHDLNYSDDNIDPYSFDMYEENIDVWYQ